MDLPEIGDRAPDFTLPGTAGPFTLSEHRGERIVLLFYPGDDSAVCTRQLCSYRDQPEDVAALGARLVGVSSGDLASKATFAARHGLTTTLLADEDGAVAAKYGVRSARFGVTKRAVIVIDKKGRIGHRHHNFLSLTYDSLDDIRAALRTLPVTA